MVPVWANRIQINRPHDDRPWWEVGMGLGFATDHCRWKELVVAQHLFAEPRLTSAIRSVA